MIKKSTILLSLALLAAPAALFAQYKSDYKEQGDKSFNNKDYYEAAYYYKEAANGMQMTPSAVLPFQSVAVKKSTDKVPEQIYVAFQLAESYRGYENYLEAEGWYYRVLNANYESKYPLARYWYGVCLRANQHFDEAIAQLTQFTANYKGDNKYIEQANKEMENCRFAKEQYKYPMLADLTKMKGDWNSDGSNYALQTRDGRSWFTSSRMLKDDKKRLNRVYEFAAGGIAKPEIVHFEGESKKDVEYGTPAFTPDGSRMYITRWYKDGAKTIHGIYFSNKKAQGWGALVKLNGNVNADSFSAIQPCVAFGGKKLLFVSNKAGGQGGYDIWVADLGADGQPVNSTNLGANINTSADEQAPYYSDADKRMVYSSKGMIGLGGFDLYEANYNGVEWSKAHNMGFPVNSAKDDLYYYPDKTDPKKFYISSDRESDCCLDLFTATDKRYVLSGLVVDCETHKALAGAKVTFLDSISKTPVKEEVLGADGKYSFAVATQRPYNLVIEKSGYFTKVLPIVQHGAKMKGDTLFNPDLCLQPFVVNKPIVIQNILYDFNMATLRPESKTVLNDLVKIMKDNPKIKIELSSHTDSIGSDAYNIDLSQRRAQSCVDYIIASDVDNARVFAKGYGKSKPIAPNSLPNGKDNPEGRQLNRRTEFTVLKVEE
ncbi:WD40 repeat protein [Mucilaginibacter yixingensis]|uniref:WD40 repeat protein n=1 Tax=Mucilaginibacter yixingensis TaxID=1295612 RepID=A0A2T5JCN1_9SPHI|nr:OmpA family protein [Mucilaginibacter yixingensis]PTQ99528.1 WD40 repeat protein [Mucilaginibacter yixingensis]